MKYTYYPKDVCSVAIVMDIEDDIVKSVGYIGGCPGNLQAVAKLVEGMPVSVVKEKLSGIKCGHKNTSCADQLVKGIDEAMKKAKA
jgi:uncharacterized protein (TIGR03905 family)